MRSCLAIVLLAVVALCSSASYAAIGWAGQIWPCQYVTYSDNQDINVYVQVWKGGCTEAPGPCADVQAVLYYKRASEGVWHSAVAGFQGDIGSNDEWVATIPSSATESGDPMQYYYEVSDLSDGTGFPDAICTQCECVEPYQVNITPATERDVTVFFYVDVSCLPEPLTASMYIAGDFQGWNACNPGNQMTLTGSRLYVGNLSFAAGSNPYHEFKFNRFGTDGCQWENAIGNRTFIIDDSGPEMHLPVEMWDNWDCCFTGGPTEISGAGSYCVSLCLCDQALSIPLNTGYDPPLLYGVSFGSGCSFEITNCDEVCEPGSGEIAWGTRVDAEGQWYLDLCIVNDASALPGCFCMTIDQILPVELGSFNAIAGNREVLLNWSTRSEQNNARFEIERDGNLLTQVASFGNSASGHSYSWTDRAVENGRSYSYKLLAVDLNGARAELATAEATPLDGASIVTEYNLAQNFPNPFNPSTIITYAIPEAGFVKLAVYDLTGREVANLVNREMGAGSYSVSFDGTNLPSGLYYYRLTASDFTATQKMVLMK